MYRFEKYGTLWYYRGPPVYVGGTCITRKRLALWWPINWVAALIVIAALPFIEARAAMAKKDK